MDTLDERPTKEEVFFAFGPGEYSVLTVERGRSGLSLLEELSFPWAFEEVHVVSGDLSREDVLERYGEGLYYLIGDPKEVGPIYAHRKESKVMDGILEGGRSSIKGIKILVKVRYPL